jgi:uncharacterized protein (DUF2141 family)
MVFVKSTLVLVFILIATYISSAQNTGNLVLEIASFRNSDGVVAVALYDHDEGFPGKEENIVRAANAKIINGKAVVEFAELAFGEYAISAFHDENSNSELDTNWMGIPKEGVGASNNAKGRMGPPRYKDAKFDFEKDDQKMEFDIAYIF